MEVLKLSDIQSEPLDGVKTVGNQQLGPVKSFYLTLVRHGETHANKDGVVAGQTDAPLSVVGVAQATRLGQHLADERFDLWMASDLSRAMDTAKLVMAVNNHVGSEELKIDPRLRERSFGEAEGLFWAEVKELARSRNIKFSKYDPIGGESLECFRHRVTCFFSYLCRLSLAWPGKCPTLYLSGAETVTKLCPNDSATSVGGAPSVVAFSHGGFLRELTVYLEKHLECDFNGKQASLPVSNTGVTKFLIKTAVDLETGQLKACAECLMLRDTSHLK